MKKKIVKNTCPLFPPRKSNIPTGTNLIAGKPKKAKRNTTHHIINNTYSGNSRRRHKHPPVRKKTKLTKRIPKNKRTRDVPFISSRSFIRSSIIFKLHPGMTLMSKTKDLGKRAKKEKKQKDKEDHNTLAPKNNKTNQLANQTKPAKYPIGYKKRTASENNTFHYTRDKK